MYKFKIGYNKFKNEQWEYDQIATIEASTPKVAKNILKVQSKDCKSIIIHTIKQVRH